MIEKQIRLQIAHIMAFHGDEPETLLFKLETLVLEWHNKGLVVGRGIAILCPHCSFEITVHHLEWTAIICPRCKGEINQRG
jgi:predicted Zn-ribbon and HTH transcriptional regulator